MQDILKLLERDARLTPAQIAERTGKPEQEVRETIERAEKQGIIRNYQALIDWDRAGSEAVRAFIEVKVAPERGVGFDAVARRIMGFPEVDALYLISGDYDLHVVVEGASMKEVAYFVAEKLAPLDHVQSTVTHFLLKSYKVSGHSFEAEEEVKRLPAAP
jgi:DNA-binding Lrp family transcriptional regulator